MSQQFALVSMVDTYDWELPDRCVLLFDSEDEAVNYAVAMIVKYDENAQYQPEIGWAYYGTVFECPRAFLAEWQDCLDFSEYFHVVPVVAADSRLN